MMAILIKLFARKSKEELQLQPKPMRCLTPLVQQNSDNPNFYIELGTLGADGWTRIERIFPNSGKKEVFVLEPARNSTGISDV